MGAALWLATLFPEYYVDRGSLVETSLVFNVLPLTTLALSGALLLAPQGRIIGAGIALGVVLGGLPFVLDDLTIVLQREEIEAAMGFYVGIASSLVLLAGAVLAFNAVTHHPAIRFVGKQLNVGAAAILGGTATIYVAGQLLPSVTFSTAFGSVSSETPFSDPDLFTLWVVLGILINLAVPLGSLLLSDPRASAAIVFGIAVALIADVLTTFEALGFNPVSGATVELGPGTILQTVALSGFVAFAMVSGVLSGRLADRR